MSHSRKKHKQHEKHKHKHKKSHDKANKRSEQEAYVGRDEHGIFHGVRNRTEGAQQTVNVNVNLEQPDQQEDCLTKCWSGMAKCFK